MKKCIKNAMGICLLASVAFAQGPRVPLDFTLPKPVPGGTPPASLKSDNLEKLSQKYAKAKRPPLMVPKGVKNVALDKSVTSSDDYPLVGELELITDGDKEGVEGAYVELGPMKQHIQIDLEKPYEIHAIVVWHLYRKANVYKDVVVQVADDEDFIKNVRVVFNNDHDNSIGFGAGRDKEWIESLYGRPMPVSAEKARYVRLYSNGNLFNEVNHYIEVEVYGK